jgi:hypothetical protein
VPSSEVVVSFKALTPIGVVLHNTSQARKEPTERRPWAVFSYLSRPDIHMEGIEKDPHDVAPSGSVDLFPYGANTLQVTTQVEQFLLIWDGARRELGLGFVFAGSSSTSPRFPAAKALPRDVVGPAPRLD